MNKHRLLIVFFLLLTGFVSLALMSCDVYATAVVWTDKSDYAPWETVTIYGSGFNPNTNIDIAIIRPDSVVDTGSTMSDAFRGFTYYYVMNGIVGTYTFTATDGVNSATTTFTDSVDFRQYANDLDLWIYSILQSGKSTYYEGMSVPQRIVFVDVASTSGDVHTLTLSHEATKGGTHAYDWLTGWNQGNDPPLGYTPWGGNIGPKANAAMCQALHAKTTPFEIYVDVPDDPFISKDDSTQDRIDAYEAAWGNRQIRICGNQPIASASFTAIYHDVTNGGDTGDSFIHYTLTWTSASDQILIELAGHLAMSGNPAVNPIAWGVGLGSSQISGGPYHFKLFALDGHSLGSQDNQIMGAGILLAKGTITVVKNAVPDNPQDFSFTTDLGPSFILDDDADATYSNTKVFNDVDAGSYYVTETVPLWWDLTSITFAGDTDSGSSSAGSTATIDLDLGEQITVTFTNTKRGKIIVDKVTDPSGSSQSFDFLVTGPSYIDSFSLTDAAAPHDSGWIKLGTYAVSETVLAGWVLTSAVCSDGSPVNNIILDPGETVIVTFTDERTLPGKASLGNFVWADLNHNGVQDPLEPGVFGVTASLYRSDGTFVGSTTTDGNGYYIFTDLDPGDYYLVFALPSGYVFTLQDEGADDAVDSDVDPSTGRTMIINLQAGENNPSWDAGLIKAPVGGVWVPIEKFKLLAPWVGWASFVTASTIFVVYVNRKKKRQN